MDDSSILVKADRLRREIELIEQEERIFYKRKYHSAEDTMAHASRKLRLLQAKKELESLREKP